jgi:hypothetical protein
MTQTKPLLLLPVLASMSLFSSCIERAFFHSPLQGNIATYHATPVGSDSIKAATYVNGALSIGSMNENLRDNVFAFQAGIHRAHALDIVRLNYGASLVLGSYDVKSYYNYNSYYNNYMDSALRTGNKFFGAYGAYGGISLAMPLGRNGRRGEWRYIGIDGNLFNEFGEYYSFRQHLPDSSADEIDRKRYFGSLGLNTEIVFKGRSQNKFGIKLGFGSYLRRLSYTDASPNSYYQQHDDLLYFSNTYHFTIRKATTYFQFNIATHAVHFQLGVNYRL